MKTELALAFEFAEAPDKVKSTAELHRAAFFRIETATRQLELWLIEKDEARKVFLATQQEFARELKKWDPAGLKNNTLIKRG